MCLFTDLIYLFSFGRYMVGKLTRGWPSYNAHCVLQKSEIKLAWHSGCEGLRFKPHIKLIIQPIHQLDWINIVHRSFCKSYTPNWEKKSFKFIMFSYSKFQAKFLLQHIFYYPLFFAMPSSQTSWRRQWCEICSKLQLKVSFFPYEKRIVIYICNIKLGMQSHSNYFCIFGVLFNSAKECVKKSPKVASKFCSVKNVLSI